MGRLLPRSGLLLLTVATIGLTGCGGRPVDLSISPFTGLQLHVGGGSGGSGGQPGVVALAPGGGQPPAAPIDPGQTPLPVEPGPAAPSEDSQAPAAPSGRDDAGAPLPELREDGTVAAAPEDAPANGSAPEVPGGAEPAGEVAGDTPAAPETPAPDPVEKAAAPDEDPDTRSLRVAGVPFADLVSRQTGSTEAQRTLQAQRALDTMDPTAN